MIKKTVCIGIPAHNEEKNIASLLDSILMQQGGNFIINKVVVACDGCTDHTAQVITEYKKKSPIIQLIDDGKRMGQAARLNAFYRSLTSDIFITFDGDVKLANNLVVSAIVEAFDDHHVGLAGGNDIPFPQDTFVGKALAAYELFWSTMIGQVKNGDNVHHHPGRVSAGRREFLEKTTIPLDIYANDHFLYFEALRQGFQFKFAPHAIVYFHVPTTLQDYLKQVTRFHDSTNNIKRHFGDWVDAHYYIPPHIKLRAYATTFIHNPFYLICALFLESIQRLVSSRYVENSPSGVWDTVKSSK